MAVPTQTLINQRWGPERWQLFDYFAHPIRDPGGNPCLIWRHGGGGWAGNYKLWPNSGFEISEGLPDYLLNEPGLDQHFDVVTIQTCEQTMTNSAGTSFPAEIPRTTRHNMWDNVMDHKRAICAIKAWGTGAGGFTNGVYTYRINPDKIISGGQSFGGTVTALSMITPPITYDTKWGMSSVREFDAGNYDSTVLGVIYFSSQVDFRRRALPQAGGAVAFQNYLRSDTVQGIWGTQINDPDTGSNIYAGGSEWSSKVPNNFKDAVSLLYYIERGYTDFYVPMYTLYYENDPSHLGQYPLTSNHDRRMRDDLNAALTAKQLPFSTGLTKSIANGGGPLTDWQIARPDAISLYGWMNRLVRNGKGAKMTVFGN